MDILIHTAERACVLVTLTALINGAGVALILQVVAQVRAREESARAVAMAEVVGEADDSRAGLRLCAEHAPDAAFLDIRIPGTMSYLVSPQLTRLFKKWLYPGPS
jgi:DNA-binding NarL/FixJ family response regulator